MFIDFVDANDLFYALHCVDHTMLAFTALGDANSHPDAIALRMADSDALLSCILASCSLFEERCYQAWVRCQSRYECCACGGKSHMQI
jgi:hypothetical protein